MKKLKSKEPRYFTYLLSVMGYRFICFQCSWFFFSECHKNSLKLAKFSQFILVKIFMAIALTSNCFHQ